MKWYLIFILICISLLVRINDHFFQMPVDSFSVFFEKMSLQFFFQIFLILWLVSLWFYSLNILNFELLIDVGHMNIFFHSVGKILYVFAFRVTLRSVPDELLALCSWIILSGLRRPYRMPGGKPKSATSKGSILPTVLLRSWCFYIDHCFISVKKLFSLMQSHLLVFSFCFVLALPKK